MESRSLKKEAAVGESSYCNQNCWLARNLGYPPSKRCRYCELKFRNCLFEHYLLMTLILVGLLLAVSYLIEQSISKSLIVSLFVLVIAYGYFFNKTTEKIIIANFEEKKAKNAFKDLSDNLKQRVDEQTSEIKGQKDKVEQALQTEKQAHEELKDLDENKTQFMLITQHHLRTPLSVNMGFLDLLTHGHFGKIPAKINGVITELSESTQKEIQVVNELLDVSIYQLGKGIMKLEPNTDIEALVEETAKDPRIEAEKHGLYFKIEKEGVIPKIPVDKIKLKLALTNVMDDCVKYTKQGGVTINLKSENDKLLITIKDTGMGISKEQLPNLFKQTFERSEEAQKIFAVGKGLGLFLTGKIIEGHKGKIWVESEGSGRGSTFHIELPVK